MIHLKKFESYSYPDSAVRSSDLLAKTIMSEFKKWTSNGTEEYNKVLSIKTEPNSDFPLQKIELLLNMSFSNQESMTGMAMHFANPGDYSDVLSTFDGDIVFARMKFNISVLSKSINYNSVSSEISALSRHEIMHIYQGYKKIHTTSTDREKSLFSDAITALQSKYSKSTDFYDFISVFYSLSTDFENDASLAEITKGKELPIYVDDRIRSLKAILRDGKLKTLDRIEQSLKDNYPKINIENIPKSLIDEYVVSCDEDGVKPWSLARKIGSGNFKSFIQKMYDIIEYRGSKYIKKMHKITRSA